MSGTPANPLGMSDEDFLKIGQPPEEPEVNHGGVAGEAATNSGGNNGEAVAVGGEPAASAGDVPDAVPGVPAADAGKTEAGEAVEGADGNNQPAGSAAAADDGVAGADGTSGSNAGEPGEGEADGDAAKAADGEAGDKPAEGSTAEGADAAKDPKEPGSGDGEEADPKSQYQLYTELMAPFKANGKIVEVRAVSEARRLMQMGANYTRKMQEIAPHRKKLMMLENHKIDEEKLSFLIDLANNDKVILYGTLIHTESYDAFRLV